MITPTSQSSTSNPATAPSIDGFAISIAESYYYLDANLTFKMWFRCYEGLYKIDFAS